MPLHIKRVSKFIHIFALSLLIFGCSGSAATPNRNVLFQGTFPPNTGGYELRVWEHHPNLQLSNQWNVTCTMTPVSGGGHLAEATVFIKAGYKYDIRVWDLESNTFVSSGGELYTADETASEINVGNYFGGA